MGIKTSGKLAALLICSYFFISMHFASAQEYHSIIVKLKKSGSIPVLQQRLGDLNYSSKPIINMDAAKQSAIPLNAVQSSALDELKKYYIVNINNETDYNTLMRLLASDPEIEYYELNYIYKADTTLTLPNDPRYNEQWALKSAGAEKAWEKATGIGILVGIVDTGIDFNHPDLKNRLWVNPAEDANHDGKFEPWASDRAIDGAYGDFNGIDEDGNGYVDDVIGYDFVDQNIRNVGDAGDIDPVPFDE
ncbi:MAG: hypothetical protein QG635_1962, partial [Bacteroidota bacterium]|nr:hypothetical protein [Bacteroidota bacterium]